MIYLWGNSFCTQMFPFRGNQILYLNAFIYGNIFCNWMFSFKGKLILDLNIFIYREINFVSGCSHLQENTRAWPIIGLRPVSDRPLQGIESQIILFNLQLKHTSLYKKKVPGTRPAQLAELLCSDFDPELFPHSAYVKFFVPFVT